MEKAIPRVFNLAEAKARLSQLVKRAEKGETIYIKRYGKIVAKIVPAEAEARPKRMPGAWRGQVWIAPDFDEVDEAIAELMHGGSVEPSS